MLLLYFTPHTIIQLLLLGFTVLVKSCVLQNIKRYFMLSIVAESFKCPYTLESKRVSILPWMRLGFILKSQCNFSEGYWMSMAKN